MHINAVFGNCWDPTPRLQYIFGALCTVLVLVSDWVLYNGIIYMLDFIVLNSLSGVIVWLVRHPGRALTGQYLIPSKMLG